jgi:hypothetical protein
VAVAVVAGLHRPHTVLLAPRQQFLHGGAPSVCTRCIRWLQPGPFIICFHAGLQGFSARWFLMRLLTLWR